MGPTHSNISGAAMTLPAQSSVVVYGAVQFDLPSQITGRTYRIFVFKPAGSPPLSGYPLVVSTDGNMTFPIMATLDATFALTGKAALVVGVGYACDDPTSLFSLRTRDLTPPTPLSSLQQRPGQPAIKPEDYGGSEDFYRFMVEELRPTIAGAYSVDPDDHTLYGHSIAGMFVLRTLLNHPTSFRNFVASSPSIWWNQRSVLIDVPSFERKVRAREATPRVLILVGGNEQDVPATLPPQMTSAITKKLPFVPGPVRNGIARMFAKKMMLDWRMVDNARGLAKRLRQIKGARGYQVRFHEFALRS
jgi:predicted alpha/beta superfamily hydrolase